MRRLVPEDEHGRLDLRVVVRVVGCEQADAEPVHGPEARGRVGDALAHDHRDECREDPDSDPAAEGASVVAVSDEAGADDHVRAPVDDRLQQRRDLVRIVLAVAVDLHGEVEAVLERVLVAGLDRAADPEVEGEPDDPRARLGGEPGGRVGRAVVDDEDLEFRVDRADLAHDGGDRAGLVVRRHDRQPAHSGGAALAPAAPRAAGAVPGESCKAVEPSGWIRRPTRTRSPARSASAAVPGPDPRPGGEPKQRRPSEARRARAPAGERVCELADAGLDRRRRRLSRSRLRRAARSRRARRPERSGCRVTQPGRVATSPPDRSSMCGRASRAAARVAAGSSRTASASASTASARLPLRLQPARGSHPACPPASRAPRPCRSTRRA